MAECGLTVIFYTVALQLHWILSAYQRISRKSNVFLQAAAVAVVRAAMTVWYFGKLSIGIHKEKKPTWNLNTANPLHLCTFIRWKVTTQQCNKTLFPFRSQLWLANNLRVLKVDICCAEFMHYISNLSSLGYYQLKHTIYIVSSCTQFQKLVQTFGK